MREGEKEGHEYDQDSVTLRNLLTRSIWRQAIVIQCTGSKCQAKVMAKNTGAETLETGVDGHRHPVQGRKSAVIAHNSIFELVCRGKTGSLKSTEFFPKPPAGVYHYAVHLWTCCDWSYLSSK